MTTSNAAAVEQSLTLVHTTESFSMNIDGLDNEQIIDQLKDAGFSMGKTSLRNLLNGNVTKTCGFELVAAPKEKAAAPVVETAPAAAPMSVADAEAAVEAEDAAKPTEVTPPAAPEVAPEVIDVEAKEVIEAVAAPSVFSMITSQLAGTARAPQLLVVNAPAKKNDAKTVTAVSVPNAPSAPAPIGVNGKPIKPLRRDTKNDKIFQMLCDGATVKEISEKFGWTEGGVSSVVYWEPNDKGYGLDKEQVQGRGNVIYITIDGQRINKAQLVYK